MSRGGSRWALERGWRRWLFLLPLLSAFVITLRGDVVSASSTPGPQVGFTFRPYTAAAAGITPETALMSLLTTIHPDVVRLPVYWSDVATTPATLDFSAPDRLVDVVADYNDKTFGRHTTIVLVVGMRNVSAPELWAPAWAVGAAGGKYAAALAALPEYVAYLDATVSHYAREPMLQRWQVENEPLDDSVPTSEGDTSITEAEMAWEMAEVRRLDARHPILVTTFTSSALDLDMAEIARADNGIEPAPGAQPGGHPEEALALGNTLGLDLYVVYGAVDLGSVSAETRIAWKRNELGFWTQRAAQRGKDVWVAEMEAAPWVNVPGFTTEDLLTSAQQYRSQGPSTVLLWGVEEWLTSAQWMSAGLHAVQVLRATG